MHLWFALFLFCAGLNSKFECVYRSLQYAYFLAVVYPTTFTAREFVGARRGVEVHLQVSNAFSFLDAHIQLKRYILVVMRCECGVPEKRGLSLFYF